MKNFDTVAGYEYLVIQNMFYRIPYPNKCVCSHQNCEATSILSGDITVLRFRRPSWMPSWIVERTPLGFTGILGMLFLVVLIMFPEKFSFGISFAPSEPNALRLIGPSDTWKKASFREHWRSIVDTATLKKYIMPRREKETLCEGGRLYAMDRCLQPLQVGVLSKRIKRSTWFWHLVSTTMC